MAKNEFIGTLAKVGPIITINTRDGGTMEKREILVDGTTYDRFTGKPHPNPVTFEIGSRNVRMTDDHKVGDLVVVSFVLQGFNYNDKNTQEEKNMSKIVAYDIQPYGRQDRGEQAPEQERQRDAAPAPQQPQYGSQQPQYAPQQPQGQYAPQGAPQAAPQQPQYAPQQPQAGQQPFPPQNGNTQELPF